MVPKEITEPLASLARLEMDAALAYDEAIAAIPDLGLKDALTEFRMHHQRHMLELWRAIQERGAVPPEFELHRFTTEGFVAISPQAGTEAALRTLQHNERTLQRTYRAWVERPLPEDVLSLIRRVGDDEKHHLGFVQRSVEARAWGAERLPEAAPA